MAVSDKVYYPALTGLRAIAAYLVFFHHANPFSKAGWQNFLFKVTQEFHVGVSVFFVLSGFLIYSRYEQTAHRQKSWIGEYLQNRFARIFPLYLLLTIVVFCVQHFFKRGDEITWFSFLMNVTLLKGFFNDLKFTGIAQGWSLTTEECFYLFMPFIFWWVKRLRPILLSLLFLVMGSALVVVFRNIDFFGLFVGFKFMMIYTLFGRSFEFLAGVWIALNFSRMNTSRPLSFTTFGIIICVGLTCTLSWFSTYGQSGLYQWPGVFINNFLFPIGVGFLLIGLITETTFLSRILSSPFFQVLGKSSYAFYLIHAGIFYAALTRYVTTNVFFIFILFNIIAIGLYYLIEKPMREMLRAR